MELKINPAFRDLIPPLASEEYETLERKILAEGIHDAIIVWKGVIIDGHNRYEIAQKHGLKSYAVLEMEFADEDAAKLWIIDHQLGRRNLDKLTKIQLAQLKDPLVKEKAMERMLAGKQDPVTKSSQGRTRRKVAEIAGVSEDTVRKAEFVMENATPEQISSIRSGESTINKVYRESQTGTKICHKCGEEKPAPRFHDNTCLDCYNKRRNTQKREQRSNENDIAPDPLLYTIEAFQLEFKASADRYVDLAETFVTAHYSPLWKLKENKQIAIAALEEVAAAILKLKGLV
jgi:hypothetical protein